MQVYNTWPSTESAMASRAELRTALGKAICSSIPSADIVMDNGTSTMEDGPRAALGSKAESQKGASKAFLI